MSYMDCRMRAYVKLFPYRKGMPCCKECVNFKEAPMRIENAQIGHCVIDQRPEGVRVNFDFQYCDELKLEGEG